MAGLLYKDFIGLKGKKIIGIIMCFTLVFLIVRLILPGTDVTPLSGVYLEMENGTSLEIGSLGEVRDSLLVMLPMMLVFVCTILPISWTTLLLKNDESSRTRQFISGLPYHKDTYIASKYIFIAISLYVLFSIEMIWMGIFRCNMGENNSAKLIDALSSFLPTFSCMALMIAATELPFFITLGVKLGSLIKTGILELLFFVGIGYFLFGNLKIFENFDVYKITKWCENHTFHITLLSVISPMIAVLFYYLSYRLTCALNKNNEVSHE